MNTISSVLKANFIRALALHPCEFFLETGVNRTDAKPEHGWKTRTSGIAGLLKAVTDGWPKVGLSSRLERLRFRAG